MSSSTQQIQDIHECIHEIQFGIKCLQQVLINQSQNTQYSNDEHEHDLLCEHEHDLVSNNHEHDLVSNNHEHDLVSNNHEHDLVSSEHEHDLVSSEHAGTIEAYKMCDELISSCVSISENVQEMKNVFDEETDRLRVLINKMSNKLPFLIDRIKYRAEAQGIKLPEFDMGNIPEEAGSFYSYDEWSCEVMRELSRVV